MRKIFVKGNGRKINNPFEMEEYRAYLAEIKDLDKLQGTYRNKYEIIDNNTPKYWDDLNDQEINSRNNPMAWDRVCKVTRAVDTTKTILDVGFGSGIFEKIVYKKNRKAKIHGIDFSDLSVLRVKKRFPEGKFKKGSILKIPYNNQEFEQVIALEILEHIPPSNTFTALQELNRVLKIGGTLIVSVPLNEGLEHLIQNGKNFNAHVRIYTEKLIKSELAIAGFSVVKMERLYAFNNNYHLKSLVARLLRGFFNPNNVILHSKKVS